MTNDYTIKDSGDRERYPGGMTRDTQTGKPRHDLLLPLGVPYEEQFLTRVAMLMTRGAEKYRERNWERAASQEELGRFKASAARHLTQWLAGEEDEDHAASVVFNLLAWVTTDYKMRSAEDAASGEPPSARFDLCPRCGFRHPEGGHHRSGICLGCGGSLSAESRARHVPEDGGDYHAECHSRG